MPDEPLSVGVLADAANSGATGMSDAQPRGWEHLAKVHWSIIQAGEDTLTCPDFIVDGGG